MSESNSRGGARTPYLNTFRPEVSFEQLVLSSISAILGSPTAVDSTGAQKSRLIVCEQVQLFDRFVYPILTEMSKGAYDIKEYTKARDTIREKWKAAKTDDEKTSCALDLFEETNRILARQRLYKVKHYSYFTIRQKTQNKWPDVPDLQVQESEDEV